MIKKLRRFMLFEMTVKKRERTRRYPTGYWIESVLQSRALSPQALTGYVSTHTLVTLSFCVYNTRQLILLYSTYSLAHARLSFTSTVRQFVSLTITIIRIDRLSRLFERVYLPPVPSDGCTRFPPFLIFNPFNK